MISPSERFCVLEHASCDLGGSGEVCREASQLCGLMGCLLCLSSLSRADSKSREGARASV